MRNPLNNGEEAMFPYNATNNHVYSARNAEILEQAL